MAPLAIDIQSIPFNHKPSFLLIILTHPVNFCSERKPENLEKTHDYQQSWRTLPTCNQNFRCLQLHVRSGIRTLDLRNYFSSSGHPLQPTRMILKFRVCGVERSNYIKSLLFSDTRRVINKLIQLERYSGGYWICKSTKRVQVSYSTVNHRFFYILSALK